jgi:hypothetical protein
VRKYLENKAAKKAEEEALDGSENAETSSNPNRSERRPSFRFGGRPLRGDGLDDSAHGKADKLDNRRGLFSKRRKDTAHQRRRGSYSDINIPKIDEVVEEERPPFESAFHGQSSSNKKQQPRAVAIPYSRLKKERFYDWPPDPTVSRATPLVLYDDPVDDLDDSLTGSVPDIPMPDHDDVHCSLRRRHNAAEPSPDIPTDITF